MTKVLVERELLADLRDAANDCYNTEWDLGEARRMAIYKALVDKADAILAQPAHDVEASVPTFPCESCGAFHSYSEVSEASGYCPQCDAEYDERKMFADLVARYTALAAAPQPVAQDLWKQAVNNVSFYAHLYNCGIGIVLEIKAEHARLLAAAPKGGE